MKAREPDEFYVLVRGGTAVAVNWAGHGCNGVYSVVPDYEDANPKKGDRVILVREVEQPKRKKSAPSGEVSNGS